MHRVTLVISLIAAAYMSVGCFGFKTVNDPLEQVDPTYGYRPSSAEDRRERGKTYIYLAFSGGGTRAAALAYGVMETLRDTVIEVDGKPKTMLQEVDTLSGVSGGSFPAAYYGLFDDRIFEEFEPRFLRRNIQRAIIWRTLIPWNTVRLFTPWLSRSDIAKGIYHKSVFDEATFQTLTDAKGPVIYINATDLSSGERFTYSQGMFDVICSDIQPFPIAYAVASSSAVPMLLSPISLRNRAGTCGYEVHPWVEEALNARLTNPRMYRAARSFTQLHDSESRFVHLIDGGISDNLGLRAGIDMIETAGNIERLATVMNMDIPEQIIVISVNAETDPDPTINLSSAAPGFASMMNAVSGGQIRRYNFETLLLTHEMLKGLQSDSRDSDHPIQTFMIEVGFGGFPEPADRRHFKRIPTSFKLSDYQVDELIWAGRELLLHSTEYQRLVKYLGGQLPERTARPIKD
jgi:NTE family protein